MNTKSGKIILSITTLLFSILSASMGMGLLGASELSFSMRILCGCCFMGVPILVIAMINIIFNNQEVISNQKK